MITLIQHLCQRCQQPQVACMHPCYVKETLSSFTLRSCSLLCTPLVTVLGPYNPLFRASYHCACFVHTQNSHQCLAIKKDPRSSFPVSNSPSNHSKRSSWVLSHAFIVSHRSGRSRVIVGIHVAWARPPAAFMWLSHLPVIMLELPLRCETMKARGNAQ